MYSPNLPIEEQRRLDQSWSNQAQWGQAAGDQAQPKRTLSTAINPYREGGLTSVNPFAHNSIFQGVEEGEQKQLMEYAQAALMNRSVKSPEELAYLNNIIETKGRPTVQKPLPDGSQLGKLRPADHGPGSFGPEVRPWRNPIPVGGPNIDDTYPTADEVRPQPGPQAFLGTLLPTGRQQSGLTYSDDEKIRPPSIQVSRKHGGSLTQTVLNVLRNLS